MNTTKFYMARRLPARYGHGTNQIESSLASVLSSVGWKGKIDFT
jgi:hypothetical protein